MAVGVVEGAAVGLSLAVLEDVGAVLAVVLQVAVWLGLGLHVEDVCRPALTDGGGRSRPESIHRPQSLTHSLT